MSVHDSRPHSDRRISPIFLALLAILGASGGALWTDWGNPRIGVFLFVVAGWLVSLCLHEYAHARAALHSGDISIGTKGYLTLNPLKYTHPVYSFIMPLVFIILGGIALPGGAVFIERGRIKGKWKHSLISAAGPAVNALFALLLLVLLSPVSAPSGPTLTGPENFYSAVGYLALLQLMAAILNLLPVPGLDGYGIIEPWLSYNNRRAFANLAPYGMIIVFLLLWNTTINNWFFNDIIFNIMRWFGQAWGYSGEGNYLFHFFNLSLGSIFGH